jgi:diacylglycerol kinase family enzyme
MPDSANIIFTTAEGKMAVVESSSDDPKSLPDIKWTESPSSLNGDYGLNVPFIRTVALASDIKISVLISTLSGTQQAIPFFEQSLKPLLAALDPSQKYEVEYTKNSNTVSELTKTVFLQRAQAGVPQLLIILSGDGGIVDIINALATEPHGPGYVAPEVALIPMGTGNALANSTGITADNTLGLSTLARGSPVNLPTLRATFSPGARLLVNEGVEEEELLLRDSQKRPIMYGAVVASWGLHASLVADSDTKEYRKFGIERFGMAARENVYPADGSGHHRYKANVSILINGSAEWTLLDEKEHAYVLASLVSNLEKSFTISPASEPLSGKLRLVYFAPMPGDGVMKIMTLAYQGGKHVMEDQVLYKEIEGIRIAFEDMEDDAKWRRICLDGKIIRVESNGWVEIRPEAESFIKLRHLAR